MDCDNEQEMGKGERRGDGHFDMPTVALGCLGVGTDSSPILKIANLSSSQIASMEDLSHHPLLETLLLCHNRSCTKTDNY